MASLQVNHALDGQNKNGEIIAILSVCCVVMTVIVALRVYTRVCITHSFGADDAAIVIAQILAIASGVILGIEQYYGLGRHIWTVTDMVGYMKAFYASILVYNAALIAVKLSILLMYWRIFVTPTMRRLTLFALLCICAWTISLFTIFSLLCIPIAALWDKSRQGRCLTLVPIFFTTAIINMITDFGIFLLPLPAIRKLNLPRRQRLILGLILCLGLFTCIISIIRILTLDKAATDPDMTWANVPAAIWSYLELTVAMAAACLPALRPLAGRLFPRLVLSHKYHPDNSSDGHRGGAPVAGWEAPGIRTAAFGEDRRSMGLASMLREPPMVVVGGNESYKVSVGGGQMA